MPEFNETVLTLKEGHTWKCKPGYKIFVLDRGTLRFDIPENWVMELGDKSVRFFDKQPPDDNCRLEVSLLRHPLIDWTGLPLEKLLRDSLAGKSVHEAPLGGIHRETRPGVDLAWTETTFIDPQLGNPARSRIAIVRGNNGHALVTLDFWEADAEPVIPVWDEVVQSIDMGLKVKDPAMGEPRM